MVSIAVVILMIGVAILFIPLDFTGINLVIDGTTAKIDPPMYDYDFEIDDIVDISIIDTMPHATKINGVNSDRLYLGRFSANTYGNCRMYIYRKANSFIMIELKNNRVFLRAC